MVASGGVPQAYGVLAHAVRLMLFATFAAQICLTLAGFEIDLLGVGAFCQPVHASPTRKPRERFSCFSASVLPAGRRRP